VDGDSRALGPGGIAALERYDQAVKRAADLGQDVAPAQALWERVRAQAEQAERAWQRTPTTPAGMIGGFLGGAISALDPRTDPLNFVVLPVSAVGKTPLGRIAWEAGGQALVEAINQFTGAQEARRLLGLEHGIGPALTAIGATAVGAGVMQGLGEGVAHLLTKRARGALATGAGRESPPSPAGEERLFTPQERTTPTQRVRAVPDEPGAVTLAGMDAEDAASPWMGSGMGRARTAADVREVARQLDDWDGPRPDRIAPEPKPGAQQVIDQDPAAFRSYARQVVAGAARQSEMPAEQADLMARIDQLDARRVDLELARGDTAEEVLKTRLGLLREERQDLVARLGQDRADQRFGELAATRRLLLRAYARSQGRFAPTLEDIKHATRVIDRQGVVGLGQSEAPPRPKPSATPEHATVEPFAPGDEDAATRLLSALREPATQAGNRVSVAISGRQIALDLDQRLPIVETEGQLPTEIRLRDLLAQDQADDATLDAMRGCLLSTIA